MSDAAQIFQLRCDPVHNRYINRPLAGSIEDAHTYIRNIEEKANHKQIYFWAITIKPFPELAGTVMFLNYDAAKRTAELGYELLSVHQGKGIMYEAIAGVLNFAAQHLQLKHIDAVVQTGNERSFNILKRLSFTKDEERSTSELEYWYLNPQV